jgi:transcription elongation GreA/GreB family factor
VKGVPARPTAPDKRRIIELVRERAEADLEVATRAQRASAEGATHEEARAEGDKDMRSTEVSYLARGQAARVEELRETALFFASLSVALLGPDEPVRAGALVLVEEDDTTSMWLLAPLGAGIEVELEGQRVSVVSTRSPLGRALLGRQSGDAVSVPTPKGEREIEVLTVW